MLFLAFVGFGWDCRLVIVFLAEITIVVGCSQIVGGRYTGFGACVDCLVFVLSVVVAFCCCVLVLCF